jgi:hypothetical protein
MHKTSTKTYSFYEFKQSNGHKLIVPAAQVDLMGGPDEYMKNKTIESWKRTTSVGK